MSFDIDDLGVDPFNSDSQWYLHYETSFYGGSDPRLVVPSSPNIPPLRTGLSQTRYFVDFPGSIDISDLAGTRPIVIRDATLGATLTRVTTSPSSGEYRIVTNANSKRRGAIEFNSVQAGNSLDYDLYILGGTLTGNNVNNIGLSSSLDGGLLLNSEYVDTSAAVTSVKLKYKILEIGDWNMDTSSSIFVNHLISDYTKIKQITTMIRPDTVTTLLPLDSRIDNVDPNGIGGGNGAIDSTRFQLYRRTGGLFDNANYDSTSYNRGFSTILYTE